MNWKMAAAVMAAAVAFGACKAVWAGESNVKAAGKAVYSTGGSVYQAGLARMFGEDISLLEAKVRSVSEITFHPQNYSGAAQTAASITRVETGIVEEADFWQQQMEDSIVPEVVDENVIQEQMPALGDDADELDSLESEVEESVSETEGEDSLDSVSSNSVSSLSENSISQDT